MKQPGFIALGFTLNDSVCTVKPVVLPLQVPICYYHALKCLLRKHTIQELLLETVKTAVIITVSKCHINSLCSQ